MKKIVTYKAFFAFAIILLLASCQSYKAMLLEPEKILEDLKKERESHVPQKHLSFSDAAKLMKQNNLKLKRLLQSYKGYQKVAELKTPLSNPRLGFAPEFNISLSDFASQRKSFVSLGFSIPLGPRLRRSN